MRILRFGHSGDDVYRWELFIRGFFPDSQIVVDGKFDEVTLVETKRFQRHVGLSASASDGIVGPITLGKAMCCGFNPLLDVEVNDVFGQNWPKKPLGLKNMTAQERIKTFGAFEFESRPTTANPEAIRITDNWVTENIASFDCSQLKKVIKNEHAFVSLNKAVVPNFNKFFEKLEELNLLDRVHSWGGAFVPRFIRGSRSTLSNHSWGTAFDINVQWNMLGSRPALVGMQGSVRELVLIATDCGWYWGGWFEGRPDGMHFEIAKDFDQIK
jgi:hypothetical protein